MTSQTHRITNRTKGSLLSEGVHAVDATFEHLTVLRVLIEGLADNHEAGLWLTDLRSIPTVPRISPIDLIYVDRQQRVVEAVELLPASRQPAFEAPAVSALVLPFQTISATATRVGDQLLIDGAEQMAGVAASYDTVEGAPELTVDEELPAAEPQAESVVPAEEAQTPDAEGDAARSALLAAIARTQQETAGQAVPLAVVDLPAAMTPPMAAVAPVAVPLPAVPVSEPAPAPRVAPPVKQVLTVHEVVLPAEDAATAEVEPRRKGKGRKQKKPRTRKERRQAAVVQRNRDAVAAARELREQASAVPAEQAHGPVVVPIPPVPPPAPVAPRPAAASAVRPPQPQGAPPPPAQQKAHSRFGIERGEIMALVSRVLHWLNPNAINEEQRSSIRRPARDLVAYVGEKGDERKLDVGNISSSGMYVKTDERWEPGSEASVSLQQGGPISELSDRHVDLEAQTVRHDKDGMGLKFNLPQDMKLDLWESAATGETTQTGPDYIVHEMRVAQALGVVRSVCPQAVEQFRTMLRKDFSSVRVRDAIRITQLAEKMLPQAGGRGGVTAPAALVLRILEMGSWASEEWTQQLWAGLLVSACTPEGNDNSNAELVETLCQLAPVHLRILELASRRYAEAAAGGATQPPPITMHDLTRLLDLTNLTKTLRSVGELADRSLMTPVKRAPNDVQDENAWTAITPLGLRMAARCQGRRDSLAV